MRRRWRPRTKKASCHRDLKPANIKVRADGTVKVLDFGLAKFAEPASSQGSIEHSPTLTLDPATRVGVILGTAGSMAPEQARGKKVDKRADIWAFGVVLYEMLTGTRLFEGETVSDTLAAVLEREPQWNRVPAKMQRLLQNCLRKDPNQRLHDIADAQLLLEEAPAATSAPLRSRFPVWAALAVMAAAGAGAGRQAGGGADAGGGAGSASARSHGRVPRKFLRRIVAARAGEVKLTGRC